MVKSKQNIQVSLWQKIHACVRKIGVPAPLNYIQNVNNIRCQVHQS